MGCKDNDDANTLTNMDSFRVNERAWKLVLARLDELIAQGMSQSEIGRLLGVHRATVSVWQADRKGGERTSFRDMVRYIDRLQIPLAEVFREAEGELPEPGPQLRLGRTPLDGRVAKTLSAVAGALGVEQAAIAERMGASPEDVAAMLKGKRPMLIGEFCRMCQAVGIAPTVVLDRALSLAENEDDAVGRSA